MAFSRSIFIKTTVLKQSVKIGMICVKMFKIHNHSFYALSSVILNIATNDSLPKKKKKPSPRRKKT